MRRALQIISWLSLASTILPSALFLTGGISLKQSQTLLLVATISWFVHTPLWMGRSTSNGNSVRFDDID